MGRFIVKISEKALNEIKEHKRAGDKATNKKLQKILLELEINPLVGTGNPEPLKYNLNGYWSRRLNKKDRLIYEVKDEIVTVLILSAMGHYNDK
jgi:toxin YoeB